MHNYRYVEDAAKGTGIVIWFPTGSPDPSSCYVTSQDFRGWCAAREITLKPQTRGSTFPTIPRAYLFSIGCQELLMEFRLRWE